MQDRECPLARPDVPPIERPDERQLAPTNIRSRAPDQANQPMSMHDRSPPVRERPAWLTYAQAGERLGLSPEAVRHRARRSGWRTQPGNDGRTLVLVPDDIEPVRTPVPVVAHTLDRTPGHTSAHVDTDDRAHGRAEQIERAFAAALAAIEAAHASEATALRERADAAQALADRAGAQLAEAGARADAEITTLRDAVDGLRDRLTAMQEQLADAHAALQAVEEAKARAERAEQGRDEERGRADGLRAQIYVLNAEAERALADERLRADRLSAQVEALSAEVIRADATGRDKERAEAERDAERARADALHITIDELKAAQVVTGDGLRQAEAMVESLREAHAGELDALKAERHRLATQIDGFATRADQAEARTDSLRARVDVLQRERDAARAEAQAAAELRGAEAERRARGLVARLRAAWRSK